MERIHIAMQITEAEQHARELQTEAAKRGAKQSGAELRYRAALAIIDTLAWIKANEAEIRAIMADRKAK